MTESSPESSESASEGFNELARSGLRMTDLWPVYDTYSIEDGQLKARGPRTFYPPMARPELPFELANVGDGDEQAALAFVRKWGLLGQELRRPPEERTGTEDLAFIWRHASTALNVLELHRGLLAEDDLMLRAAVETVALREYSLEEMYPGDAVVQEPADPGDYWDDQTWGRWSTPSTGHIFPVSLTDLLERPGKTAHLYIWDLLSDHYPRVTPTLRWRLDSPESELRKPSFELVFTYHSLLGALYLHLIEMVGGRHTDIGRCEECGRMFERTDRRQRFCPPAREHVEAAKSDQRGGRRRRVQSRCQMRHAKRLEREHTREKSGSPRSEE